MSDDAANQHPQFDLMTFAMGLAFWSICTALSLAGLMIKAGVATASGFWAELAQLYHGTIHTILNATPVLVGLPKPEITPDESIDFGAIIVFMVPFLAYLFQLKNSKAILYLAFVSVLILFSFVKTAYGERNYSFNYSTIWIMLAVLSLSLIFSYQTGGGRHVLYFLRNLLGAVVILTSLATTGFFAVG